jgi:hypothetical protein
MSANNFSYFLDNLGIVTNNYKIDYYFTNNQIINSLLYTPNNAFNSGYYSGNIVGVTGGTISNGLLNLNGKNAVIVNNATGLINDTFSFFISHNKTGSGDAVLLSTLNSGLLNNTKSYSGFNFGLTNYNNYYYEYYDLEKNGPTFLLTNAKASTNDIVCLTKNQNSLNINIYDPVNKEFSAQEFRIVDYTSNFNSLTIGSGKQLDIFTGKNYVGNVDKFVFMQDSLNSAYINYLVNGFIYGFTSTISYTNVDENYSYVGLTGFQTGVSFNSFSGIIGNCLDSYAFFDFPSEISGKISGVISAGTNTATGFFTGYYSQNLSYTRTINTFFSGQTGSITGTQLVISGTGVTGYINFNLNEIINFCGSGFSLMLTSGLTGIQSGLNNLVTGLTGTGIVTSTLTINDYNNVPYSGLINKSTASAGQIQNYTYNFLIRNNGGYIYKSEILEFRNPSIGINQPIIVSKESNDLFEKTTSLQKDLTYLNNLGIDKIVINSPVDSEDVVEVYAFSFEQNNDILLNEELEFNRAKNSFRLFYDINNSSLNSNGVLQVFSGENSGYYNFVINKFKYISGNFDLNDFINLDINKTGLISNQYTGDNLLITGNKDFIYLNGQKLASGLDYYWSGDNSTYKISGKSLVDGLVVGYDSILDYIRLTGNNYVYNLPRKYAKNSFSVYLNGIKLEPNQYYQASKYDNINSPVFLENNLSGIYNILTAPEGNK